MMKSYYNKSIMKEKINKVKNKIKSNPKVSIFIILIFLVISFFVFKNSVFSKSETTYLVSKPKINKIETKVTSTGQVSSSNQIELQAKTGGVITNLYVKNGDFVKAGQIIATVENQNQLLSLRQAQNSLNKAYMTKEQNLESQNIQLNNLEINLNSSLKAIPDSLNKDLTTPEISGFYNSQEKGKYLLKTYSCSGGICLDYDGIEKGNNVIKTGIPMSLGIRGLYLTFSQSPGAENSWTIEVPSTQSNNYLSLSQNIEATKKSNEITLENNDASIKDSLLNLEIAKLNYENTIIRSPISGQIGKISIQKGQNLSSGGVAAILIGDQKYAEIPFNEVDVAKISIDDKATITFDAIDDLIIEGKVLSIDQIGEVSSGVVNYNVKVGFNEDNKNIKSGMSTTVEIITDSKEDILTVPTSAIKEDNKGNYILKVNENIEDERAPVSLTTEPEKIYIKTGINDDENTEIVSDLDENIIIVLKTNSSKSKSTSTKNQTPTATSILKGQTSSSSKTQSQRQMMGPGF
jgi:HlyD family secretion protein